MALTDVVKSLAPFICSGTQCRQIDSINSQEKFAVIIERERARSDRNGHGFSIIAYKIKNSDIHKPLVQNLLTVLPKRMRITDEIGWFDDQHIGLLLYSSKFEDAKSFAHQVESELVGTQESTPKYSILTYPSSFDWPGSDRGQKRTRDEKERNNRVQRERITATQDRILTVNHKIPKWKRLVDIAGASIGLFIFAPLFLSVAIFIKIVSPGPIFFKQVRIGYGGKSFMFWKFRTMKVDVDSSAHRKLLAELINCGDEVDGPGKPMAKLDHDPQIIPLGNILRKTCVDELPQLINVLKGEMSLIGPRPPIPYEVEEYDRWHKGRLATIQGMTGLWQVSGKNKLTFKEMVRLDIRYLQDRSLINDLKILFQTPKAIVGQVRDIL